MKSITEHSTLLALLALPLMISVCHSATTDNQVPQISEKLRPIPGMFERNVVLLTGINFETGKPVIVNAMNGQIVQPCTPPAPANNPPSSNGGGGGGVSTGGPIGRALAGINKPCIASVGSAPVEVLNAIEASQQIMGGTMKKGDKEVPARFAVSVTALYPGSDCVTYISGGNQYQVCSSLQADCQTLLPLSAYGYLPEVHRRNIRNTCRQFPAVWRNPDCTHLKPVYRSPAMPYSLNYERYIYDSCKYQGGWGTRP